MTCTPFGVCVFSGTYRVGYYDTDHVTKSGGAPGGDDVLTVVNNSGTITFRLNGVEQTGTEGCLYGATDNEAIIGSTDSNASSNNFNGAIYDIKIFNQVLTGQDLTDAEA